MGVEVLLAAGLVLLAGILFAVSAFERRVREEAENLLGDTERMLDALEGSVVAEPAVRRRRRDARHRGRRRKKKGGSESR